MRTSLFAFALVSVTLSGGVAHAQKPRVKNAVPTKTVPAIEVPVEVPKGPPSLAESLKDDAKRDYESGKLLYGDGDYAGALVKFQSAHQGSNDPRLLWNMAACEKNLRHYAKSLRLVRTYQKNEANVLSEQDLNEAKELLKVMEPFTATLKLNINEPGAEVTIDDEVAGTTPIDPLVVDIGTRKIRIKKADFEEFAKDVPVGGAAEVVMEAKLVRIVHEGRLHVTASNNGTITIDDRVVGSGSWTGVLRSGGHRLRVSAPKMVGHQSEVLIQDNQSRDVGITLEAEPSKGVPAWVWIAGGVVVAGGATLGGYMLLNRTPTYEGPTGNLSPGVVQASVPIHLR